MPQKLTLDQTRLLRSFSQRLPPNTTTSNADPAQVVKAIVGIQAQDMAAAELSIRARSRALTVEDVRQARERDRSIVLTWLMRGTMHIVSSDDLGWLLPFFGPKMIRGSEHRYRQLGLTPEFRRQGTDLICKALAEHSAMTRAELAAVLAKSGIPTEGQAIVHLLGFAASEGAICFGAYRDREPTYALLDAWLPHRLAMTAEQTLAELATRYLSAYAPATAADLASWAGISMAQARAGFATISDTLYEVEIASKMAYLLKSQTDWLDADKGEPIVRLLPAYDTYLLGYQSRDFMLASAYTRQVHPGGGVIHPTLMVDGMIAGTWRKVRSKDGITVQIKPFEPLPSSLMPMLEAETQDIGRFLAMETKFEIENP